MKAVVTAAGGFIGGHLVNRLVSDGFDVLAVDRKPLANWCQANERAENVSRVDLNNPAYCNAILARAKGAWVFNLASDMGGVGFLEKNKATCMLSVLSSTNMLVAAEAAGVDRYFFSSSAAVYPTNLQSSTDDVIKLKEEMAYPALAEDGYGWEKLFGERMCRHFKEDFGLEARVARFHQVYGPYATYSGGRERVAAAMCRKVAEAKLTDGYQIQVWGGGEQLRSFMYVDDCVDGMIRLMESDVDFPVNMAYDKLYSINELISIIEEAAGIGLDRVYDTSQPQGAIARQSDNELLRTSLGWEPTIPLEFGIVENYKWVYEDLKGKL